MIFGKNKNTGAAQAQRIAINSLLIVAGLLAILFFMSHMQRQYSAIKATQTSASALDRVIETLDANTEKVEALKNRYHEDNHAILADMAYLLNTPHYSGIASATQEERTGIMNRLSGTITDSGYLFVIDSKGTVVMAPQQSATGDNLIENGTLTAEQLDRLLSDPENTVLEARIAGADTDANFYVKPLTSEYTLVYAASAAELERQFDALRQLGPILSSVVVGNGGFVFAVDAETARFMYCDDGKNRLDGTPIADCGLTEEILNDSYSGIQTIDGVQYQCLSRTYSSPFYGEYTVITAVAAADEVFAGDRTAIGLTAIAFTLCAFVIILYAALLRMDPEQLATYDDKIYSRGEVRHMFRTEAKAPVRNVRMFKIKGEQIYLKAGIAEKLAPIVAIAAIVVFVISWNSQMLVEISRGMQQSRTAIQQLDMLFSNRDSSSEIIMNRYQNQYLSKLQLISFLLDEDPSVMDTLNSDREDGNVHVYLDNELEPVMGREGKPVRSVANAQVLGRLAENNRFEYLALYDDMGRTIAVNGDLWYFTINRDADTQSGAFLDVLTGKTDALIQQPMTDEGGREMQYLATVYYYYTLAGEGPAAGSFVSRQDYESYTENGSFKVDGEEYRVVRRRGMLQGGIADATVMSIMDSTSNAALMQQMKVGENGFTMLFDNTREHVCLWSPQESSIGRTAAEMNISDAAFSGTFKGFTNINGTKYFQMYTFDNGYWVATALPSDSMLAGRDPIALITTIVALAFYLILLQLCIFSTENEENALETLLETRISGRRDNGMVKVMMPSGKMKYVRSAAARYTDTAVSWADMTTNQRLSYVLRSAAAAIIICFMIACIFCEQIFGPDSAFTYIVHGDWEHSFNYFAVVACTAVIVSVWVAALIVHKFINFIIRNMGSRIETVGRLLLSVIKYGSVLFSIFYGLSLLGFSTTGLVTSAGIMSIVIGLGAQSLISDILSGIFIVFEGAFRVGDIVTLDDFRGSVVDIGLRTTKVESAMGDIKIFNNASIAGIINMTKKASKAMVDVRIEYGEDLEKVEKILKEALPGIGDREDRIIGHPIYIGVAQLADSGVQLRIIADCAEQNRFAVANYMNRELYMLFRQHNINIPFPTVTVNGTEPNE